MFGPDEYVQADFYDAEKPGQASINREEEIVNRNETIIN
jgi:hypothetical protein